MSPLVGQETAESSPAPVRTAGLSAFAGAEMHPLDLTSLRSSLREAGKRYQRVLARANALGLLRPEDLVRARQWLKSAVRLGRVGVAVGEAETKTGPVVRRLDQICAEIQRLEGEIMAWQCAVAEQAAPEMKLGEQGGSSAETTIVASDPEAAGTQAECEVQPAESAVAETLIRERVPASRAGRLPYVLGAQSLDEIPIHLITEKGRRKLKKRLMFVSFLESGVPVKEALQRSGLNMKPRSVRHFLEEYRERGWDALLDRRTLKYLEGRNRRTVRTPPVDAIIKGQWVEGLVEGMPAIEGDNAVARRVRETCGAADLPVPSDATVRRALAEESTAAKLLRSGQKKKWQQTGRSVVRTDQGARNGNTRWQYDNCHLKFWVRVPNEVAECGWEPARAFLTSFLCAYSRVIPGYTVRARTPNSWVVARTLRKAILPKKNPAYRVCGIPDIGQPDRGKDLIAKPIGISLAKLKVRLRPDPPRYPNGKGKKERWYRFLDTNCLRGLPGHARRVGKSIEAARKHVMSLLTIEELDQEIEHWIVDFYHNRPHRSFKKDASPEFRNETPLERWQRTVIMRMPESEEALDEMLLKNDIRRVVRNDGIHLTLGGEEIIYMARSLEDWKGREVTIARDPEDQSYVIAYCGVTGERIDRIPRDPDYRDVIASRQAYDAQVKARLARYAEARDEALRQAHAERDRKRGVEAAYAVISAAGDEAPEHQEGGVAVPVANHNAPRDAAAGDQPQDEERSAPVAERAARAGRKRRTRSSAVQPVEPAVGPIAGIGSSAEVIDLMARFRSLNRGEVA
jgi:hypothetical protein